MGLEMNGHIDGVFQSFEATFTSVVTGYDAVGLPVKTTSAPVPFLVNVQPVNPRELDILTRGNQRIVDPRKIWVNDGDLSSITLNGEWEFQGQRWKSIQTDYRPLRSYCKVIVSRIDPQ